MVFLIVAYVAALHLSIAFKSPGLQAVALGILGLVVLYAPLMKRRYWAWLLLSAWIAITLMMANSWSAKLLLFMPSVLMPLLMLLVFAPTLAPGRTAMITSVAAAIRGDMPADLAIYTRRVTQMWTAVFLLMTVLHLVLAIWASAELWSLVSNFISYLVVAAIFLLEHLYHSWRYSHHWHPSFTQFLKALGKIDYRTIGRD